MPIKTRVLLTSIVAGSGGQPPTEFRLFRAGINQTSKGDFVFDAQAAQSVMASYRERGVDVHIDLEHLSLDQECENYDPDARGWAQLELRNGELWATNVRWTPDGARRLSEKTQRYISPAFNHDSKQITSLVNIALTGLPATHETPALVAASIATERLSLMDPAVVKAALEALKTGDGAAAITVLEQLLTAAASGDAGAAVDPSSAGDAGSTAGDPTAAALSVLGMTAEELAEAKSARETLSQQRVKERADLVGELVQLGAETPATAWDGEASARKPVARLASEDLSSLRSRVTALSAAKGKPVGVKPPATRLSADPASSDVTIKLSASDVAYCKARNISHEDFAAMKAAAVKRG